jgi:hypothetical protein
MTLIRPRRRWITPNAVAIFLNVVVLAVLCALMAAGIERTLTARSISAQIGNLGDNLTLLLEARQATVDRLHADLDGAKSELAQTQSQVPKLGTPFELYSRGFGMGPDLNVVVDRIQYQGSENMSTQLGDLTIESYTVNLTGSMPDCVAYIRQLEHEGRPFLATDNVNLDANQLGCSFGTTVLGTDSSGAPASP